MAIAGVPAEADKQVAYWAGELNRAKKRFRTFWDNGDQVIDAYRLQKADGNDALNKDKYNILYSSVETTRPNLYAQMPKPRVVLRNVDMATDTMRLSARLLEGCLKYIMQEEGFDELMEGAVEDYLLPGMGTAWVRYEARFKDIIGDDGQAVTGPDGEPRQELLDEMVKMEYVYWQDFLTGVSRTWKDTPWVARRLWLTKEQATERFGKQIASQLTYATREGSSRDLDNPAETAEAWEIWNRPNRTAYWYAEGLPTMLDVKKDPLKLKNFFPCPKPMRAIFNTRTFVPRSLYSQYKSQAETLNVLTKRIRLLGEALRVVGVYDGSIQKLSDLLNPAAGNRMIAVDSWAAFAQNGGIAGAVAWLPIDQVVKVLNELLNARETCKAEIYEITGLSDIVRGVSKASETLGAQDMKANFASARLKRMQKQVQCFARDIVALAGELIAEHCAPETIAVFSGLQIPTPQDVQANPQVMQQVQAFKAACALMKSESRRVASIDIETDSTLQVDEQQDKTDRAQFLAAAGAFLQQAVPAMEATPQLGPLLGAMLMFTVRSFPNCRDIEDEFEKVSQALLANAAQPQDNDKDGKKAAAAAQQAKTQAEAQLRTQELQQKAQNDAATAQNTAMAEQNRHAERMMELQIRQQELDLKSRELALQERVQMGTLANQTEDTRTKKFTAIHAAGIAEMELGQADDQAAREEAVEYAEMDHESAENALDRAHEADQADQQREHDAEQATQAQEASAAQAEAQAAAKAESSAKQA